MSTALRATLVALLALSAACDRQPPVWPEGAAVDVAEVTGSYVNLTWPPASDDHEVAAYRLRSDDGPITEVDGSTHAVGVYQLEEAVRYEWRLEAVDAAGNASPPLPVTFETLDVTAPTWPEGASLIPGGFQVLFDEPADTVDELLRRERMDGVSLTWPLATDNVGVSAYRIALDGELVGTAPGTEHTFDWVGEEPYGTYCVVAVDEAGNASSDALEADWESFPEPGLGVFDAATESGIFGGQIMGGSGPIDTSFLEGTGMGIFGAPR